MKTSRYPLTAAIGVAGLSMADVAVALGVSVHSVQSYAGQTAALPERHVAHLAVLLGIPEDAVRSMGRDCSPLVARRLLRERGMSYDGLPELLGLSYQRLSATLCGHRPMPRHAAAKLADLLDEPVERVLAREMHG